MTTKRLEPIHPGEILEEEFMRPLGLSANALARRIDVPADRLWLFPDAGSCAGINCSGVLP
jgi:plasmid maintenance system antidote protein VapI